MDKDEKLIGCNAEKPPIKIRYADLEGDPDEFKRRCPVCKRGMLLIRRNHKTFKLEAKDNCILCGQQFVYIDIGKLNRPKKK